VKECLLKMVKEIAGVSKIILSILAIRQWLISGIKEAYKIPLVRTMTRIGTLSAK